MHVVWFEEPSCSKVALVGGKTANLGRLASSHRVPPGFCLTTRAFVGAMPSALDSDAPTRSLPSPIVGEITAAYDALARRVGAPEPTVAVRSSAADEDSDGASFAGQHETYLNIVGAQEVVAAIQRCWDSARSDRAMRYRRQKGLRADGVKLAVLVQQLVVADVSAVAFSANPVTGHRGEVVINASWGLGESIVGGTVTPDSFVVGKPDMAVLLASVAQKSRMTIPIPGGTREVDVPRLLRTQPALRNEQAIEVAHLACSLEQTMGWPVDIECAFRDGALYLLQCRPITTLRQSGSA